MPSLLDYRVTREGREFHFKVFAGYASLMVWSGPEVLCQGGHLKVGSALQPVPSLKEVAEKWLSQYFARVNSNTKGKRKK